MEELIWLADGGREVIACMAEDFREPLGYLAAGTAPALAAAAVWTAADHCLRKEKWRTAGPKFLFCLYVYVVVWQALISREPGSRTGVDPGLFATWQDSAQSKAYVLENVLMFLPLGALLPLVWKKAEDARICVLAGAACSAFIELLQYLTARGHCQTDDLVMNTLGALAGWGGMRLFLLLKKTQKKF